MLHYYVIMFSSCFCFWSSTENGCHCKPTKILNDFYNLGNDLSRGGVENLVWKRLGMDEETENIWTCHLLHFITIYSLFGFFWSTFYTLFGLLIMYNVTMHFCFGRGYPILTQVQFPPASCGSRAQAVWPHRRLPDLCPVLVRWWGCTARAGDVFGFFRWCLWGHTWCMGVG